SSLPEFDQTFTALVHAEVQRRLDAQGGLLQDLQRRQDHCDRALANLAAAIAQAGPSATLIAELHRLESQRDQLLLERQDLQLFSRQTAMIPTPEQIKDLARQTFDGLAQDSPEFARLMRKLISRLEVFPYQLCDGGGLVPRVHLTIDL